MSLPRISIDQAHAHAETHVQGAVDNLVYWATRMIESNDRGDLVTAEVRDNLEVVLREAQALNEAQTQEAVAWWIGRYLGRRATHLEQAVGAERMPPAQLEQAAPTD